MQSVSDEPEHPVWRVGEDVSALSHEPWFIYLDNMSFTWTLLRVRRSSVKQRRKPWCVSQASQLLSKVKEKDSPL